jgi:hypothetical protein
MLSSSALPRAIDANSFPMAIERNLILVAERRHMDPDDFERIAERIRALDDSIKVFVVENGSLNMRMARKAAERPTLVVCPVPLDMFRPRRGRIFQGQWIGKIEELHRMDASGLPVPAWQTMTPLLRLRAEDWGPAVVVKPAFGGQNKDILLMPTAGAHYVSPQNFPKGHRGNVGAMIAQRFVDAGPHLPEYRVLCLFGEPLYAIRLTSTASEAAEWPPSFPLEKSVNISALLRQRRAEFTQDADVLALARRIHRAMPDVATTGCDIVRDTRSGALYVMEANCKGFSWHFSSSSGRRLQVESGLDFFSQFDAVAVAARVLIERTNELAV